MIHSDTLNRLYNTTSIQKKYIIEYDGGTIDDSNMVSESAQLKESLCEESILIFGCCNASEFSFTYYGTATSFIGKVFYVKQVLTDSNNVEHEMPIGKYTVIEDNSTSDSKTRKIKAVDDMYFILNRDMTEWYNELELPITVKEFRDKFFEEIGVVQVDTELINDTETVERTLYVEQISGAIIIQAICEINGVFGHITRDRKFKYISLINLTERALYPAEDLYPGETLYPGGLDSEYLQFDEDRYFSVDYANYITNENGINRLIVRMEENDIGIEVGEGDYDNVYVIQGNFLVYGKEHDDLSRIATKLYNKIKYIGYTSLNNAVVMGNPCIEVGDMVGFYANGRVIYSYVLERNMRGISALKDTFKAKGEEKYSQEQNGINAKLNAIQGYTKKVESSVNGLSVTVEDLATETSAALELKIDKTDNDQVVSMINASADVITLNSNRFVVNSDKFSLNADGKVTCSDMNITGGEIEFSTNLSYGNDITTVDKNGFKFHVEASGPETASARAFPFETSITGNGIKQETFNDMTDYYTPGDFDNAKTKSFCGKYRSMGLTYAECNAKWYIEYDDGQEAYVEIDLNNQDINKFNIKNVQVYLKDGANLDIEGDLIVRGTKNRAVYTEKYGTRLLNAVESATANFCDYGNGRCEEEIKIEPIFAETVDLSKGYQVFVTPTCECTQMWVEKRENSFIVHGHGTFDYQIVARQRDYAEIRLEKFETPLESEE